MNNFGGYRYRSCEDIIEAVKPLLESPLVISDEVVEIGGRVYVKATAKYDTYMAVGYAREAETKKGMDDAQITGAASSYARKYALNGLFCIDDTKDADHTNNHGKADTKSAPVKPQPKPKPHITEQQAVDLLALCSGRGLDIATVLAKCKLKEFSDCPVDKYDGLVNFIEKMEVDK